MSPTKAKSYGNFPVDNVKRYVRPSQGLHAHTNNELLTAKELPLIAVEVIFKCSCFFIKTTRLDILYESVLIFPENQEIPPNLSSATKIQAYYEKKNFDWKIGSTLMIHWALSCYGMYKKMCIALMIKF